MHQRKVYSTARVGITIKNRSIREQRNTTSSSCTRQTGIPCRIAPFRFNFTQIVNGRGFNTYSPTRSTGTRTIIMRSPNSSIGSDRCIHFQLKRSLGKNGYCTTSTTCISTTSNGMPSSGPTNQVCNQVITVNKTRNTTTETTGPDSSVTSTPG